MTLLFSDTFGTIDFSAWNNGHGSGCVIITSPVHTGAYAAQCSGSQQWFNDILPSGYNELYFRGYFIFPALPADGVEALIMRIRDTAGTYPVGAGIVNIAGQMGWRLFYGAVYGDIFPATINPNQEYCVEIRRSVGSGNGVVSLWVDGVLIGTHTDQTISGLGQDLGAGNLFSDDAAFVVIGEDFAASDVLNGPMNTGTLTVTAVSDSTAVAANVSVGGQSGTTPVTFALNPGTYVVTGTYGGKTLTASVTVITGQNASLSLGFGAAAAGYIDVHAFADGTEIVASIVADGQSGTTPATLTFAPGTYSITATYQGQTLPAQTVVLSAGQTATVNFHFTVTVSLEVTAGPNGSVSPVGLVTLIIGHVYQFEETPATGYAFNHWDLNGASMGSTNPLSLTVTAAMNGQVLTALFAVMPPAQVSMNLAVSGSGSTNPAAGAHTFNVGDTVQFTAIPAAGQTFTRWTMDGIVYTENPLPLSITADMQGKTLTAEFSGPAAGGLDLPTIGGIILTAVTIAGAVGYGAAHLAGYV